ncbi:MAG: hypothetical protein QM791_12585 [Ferruginibacter sp.]
MTKSIFLLPALIFSVITSSAQAFKVNITYTTKPASLTGSSYIFYSPGEKLAIGDFQADPESNSRAVAITSSGFAFSAGFRGNEDEAVLNIDVYCNFNKSKSWMKEKGKNKYILGHEQLHFDISYLTTMRFIQKLKQAKFTTSNYNQVVQKIYRESVNELQAKQDQYDSETMNGQLEDKQLAWMEKVGKELESIAIR